MYDSGLAIMCDGLANNKTLVMLDISKNDLTSTSIKKLSSVLSNSEIIQLNLRQNAIGNEGVSHLCNYIEKNCKLKYLNLAECRI